MRYSYLFTAVVITVFVLSGCVNTARKNVMRPDPWICFYGEVKGGHDFFKYKLAVLEPENVNDLDKIKSQGTVCIAYVSLGEAEDYRWYWDELKDKDFILEQNPDWEGNYYIDPRSEQWKHYFVYRIIPKVLKDGYDGIFLDTIDTAEYLEWKDEEKFKGSMDAMVEIIKEIRANYPNIIIISNNGLAILDKFAKYIDIALVEDLYTMYDFENQKYGIQDKEVTKENRDFLKEISREYHIPVLTLEYANNKNQIKNIYNRSRVDGFYPYVGDINLERFPK
ncbi:endo alpha-1,4 polygalactosaminidase [bacterium]|nr:endo alpha-1,4 polygalactosaminidase [bacterium]